MSQNKKLTLILIISLIVIIVLITQVIIPCIDMHKEQQKRDYHQCDNPSKNLN